MDVGDWTALGSAIVAVISLIVTIIFSLIAVCASRRSQTSAKRSQDIALGQAENELRAAISRSRERTGDLAVQITEVLDGRKADKLPAADRRRYESLEKVFNSSVEETLNAYENACGKYIDNKVDRQRFEKTYFEEVRKICEQRDNFVAELMHPETPSHFKAIWHVYHEWHVGEP